jgi:hypothetical protein
VAVEQSLQGSNKLRVHLVHVLLTRVVLLLHCTNRRSSLSQKDFGE